MTEIDFTPIPGREQPRFAAIKTFFRLPHVPLEAGFDVALAGLPYDGALSYRPGARFAPHLRAALMRLAFGAIRS